MGGWSLLGDNPLNKEFEKALNAESYAGVSELADPSVLRLLRERKSVGRSRTGHDATETPADVPDDHQAARPTSEKPPLPKRRR
ncbi:MAG: hypothetical protein KatS3mg008_0496 [Acidimicrobiales bacterium]|nr:MAG: hypothetical protein KatS3mg008_0496 [Acidimicrobiales bacterium]